MDAVEQVRLALGLRRENFVLYGQSYGALAHSLEHTNQAIYRRVQGRSELAVDPNAVLAGWDRTAALADITVPTLVIGATYDTMDPAFLRAMAERLPNGAYWHCPNGSHLCIYDDQENYFAGTQAFLSRLPP